MSREQIIALLLAAGLGGLIGLERQIDGKPAGVRTNILICLGATVFTLVSKLMAVGDGESTTRIAAQVVTGIGFLGAGAIIREPKGVHGLTTAATIWLVASIGVACGAGLYALAVAATVICGVVLLIARWTDRLGHAEDKPKHEK